MSQFISAPTSTHYATLRCVLYYLHGTITRSLLFSLNFPHTLQAYPDVGWTDDLNIHRFTTIFCIFLGASLISWRSKRLDIVA